MDKDSTWQRIKEWLVASFLAVVAAVGVVVVGDAIPNFGLTRAIILAGIVFVLIMLWRFMRFQESEGTQREKWRMLEWKQQRSDVLASEKITIREAVQRLLWDEVGHAQKMKTTQQDANAFSSRLLSELEEHIAEIRVNEFRELLQPVQNGTATQPEVETIMEKCCVKLKNVARNLRYSDIKVPPKR